LGQLIKARQSLTGSGGGNRTHFAKWHEVMSLISARCLSPT